MEKIMMILGMISLKIRMLMLDDTMNDSNWLTLCSYRLLSTITEVSNNRRIDEPPWSRKARLQCRILLPASLWIICCEATLR
jgi:hypothetical protein